MTKQPSKKKIEKAEPLSAEEIKAANQKMLEEWEEAEARNAVLCLPNTGDDDDSSDDQMENTYHKEESQEAEEDDEAVKKENAQLKAYLRHLQSQKF